jgi:hypothetical protein
LESSLPISGENICLDWNIYDLSEDDIEVWPFNLLPSDFDIGEISVNLLNVVVLKKFSAISSGGGCKC